MREKRLGGQEMFVPLVHPPGDAPADFGEALVVVDGVERKAHYLVVDLPHSADAFVKAFPAETTEAFCEGHNAAFHDVGGVPRGIVYDNTKRAVARILGDGTRQRESAEFWTGVDRRHGRFRVLVRRCFWLSSASRFR